MLLPKKMKLFIKNIMKDDEEINKKDFAILDNRVDDYINWYQENTIQDHCFKIFEYEKFIKLRNLIEKMAVWYELRYPDYVIDKFQLDSVDELIKKEFLIFDTGLKNDFINGDIQAEFDWELSQSTLAFIDSLPLVERKFFLKPKYRGIVYISLFAHLHLSSDGYVTEAEKLDLLDKKVFLKDSDLKGMHIENVLKILEDNNFTFPETNELLHAIKDYKESVYKREEFLNCIMYRIIERGGKIIGPRRAFLFAKEFKRNIDIPFSYGVYSDRAFDTLKEEYFKQGNKDDLICYTNYFSRLNKQEKVETTTLKELYLYQAVVSYTPEEMGLYDQAVSNTQKVKKLK